MFITYEQHIEVSIHAPREGERRRLWQCGAGLGCFNPRSPRGGATKTAANAPNTLLFQSTLPARGSDPINPAIVPRKPLVSIHAPREGERQFGRRCKFGRRGFQSTLPARGSDIFEGDNFSLSRCFNPRSPRGGATFGRHWRGRGRGGFNPRSPRGGATHAFREARQLRHSFNPRSPRGGATAWERQSELLQKFQSTLPARGSDNGI